MNIAIKHFFTFSILLICAPKLSASSILVTYFEPFSVFTYNSSEDVAKKIEKDYGEKHQIKLCKLPVVLDSTRTDLDHEDKTNLKQLVVPRSGTAYSNYLDCKSDQHFDFILSIGMEPRNKFKFELFAKRGIVP